MVGDEHDDMEEAPYEPEDIGCDCAENGIDSEWMWSAEDGCFICAGCGAVQ